MLSRGKVTPASVSYYCDTVAGGLEDYYAGRGEAPGTWVGRGSVAAGLSGEVSAVELARLFDGRHPLTGDSLGAPYRVREGADRVTGWDLTFSAPKSVSVLWAVPGGRVAMAVREGHDEAVAAGLAYLEEHAAFSRQGKRGVRQVDTEGLPAAAFVHRSSRAGDPQLHTHVLVSGRVRCLDGVWRALDSRALHRELKTAGIVYQSALRAELTNRLGVAWTDVDRHGQAEIVGVPLELRQLFSKRHAAVEARALELIADAEAKLGRPLTTKGRRRIHEIAVLETRPAKEHMSESDEGLHDRWRAEAAACDLDPDRWAKDVEGRASVAVVIDREAIVAAVVEELATSTSTWARIDVVRQVARRVPSTLGGAETVRSWVETVTDAVLDHPAVVRLAAPEQIPPPDLRRRDGRSVFERHGAPRYTTQATLAIEQRVVDIATAGRHAERATADPDAVEQAIGQAGLDSGQAEAVRAVALGGDAVACVVGPAGTGKSRTMGAAADAWEASGMAVRGLAVSAVAAGVLEVEAGIASDTIAKFLHEHDRPAGPTAAWRLRAGEVVVVDEAGMVASADLARLIVLADEAAVKLVLVGDHAQLGAVEAGGLFRLLARDGAVELSDVHRFHAEWERTASLRLRERDPSVIGLYEKEGRVLGGERHSVLDDALARWRAARAAGESIVLCAGDHATVDELACRIRAARVDAGEVEVDGVTAGEQTVGVGDEIVTTRNDRRLVATGGGWVRNGDRWTVTARHPDGSLKVEDRSGRGRLRLPADYVSEHVALAYAVTIHKAQGVTVDRAVVIVDERATAEALYVGMTRGRASNTALVVCDAMDPDHPVAGEPPTASAVLADALQRTSAEHAALDVLRDTLHASESIAVLVPRLANIDAWILREAPPGRSAELERLAIRQAQVEQHARPGRLTSAGRDDRRYLRALEKQREELAAAQQGRQEWFAAHGDTLAYRDDVAASIARRRHALGALALAEQPEHLVRLVGPVPNDPDRAKAWASRAAQIEAYREEWSISPTDLRERPSDAIQCRAWQDIVHVVEDLSRPLPDRAAIELNPSVGIDF